MAKYANIIIDISHEKLDKTFQYRIPPEIKDEITEGMQVIVPSAADSDSGMMGTSEDTGTTETIG